jgi:ribosomal protein S27AE
MKSALLIIQSLVEMGFRVWVEKANIRLSFRGQIEPDTSELKRLLGLLKVNRAEVLAYLAPFEGSPETLNAIQGSAIPPCQLCPAFWPAWKSEDFDGWCLYHRDWVDQDTPVCREYREARVIEDRFEYPHCPKCGGVVFAPNQKGQSVCFKCVWKPWKAARKSNVREEHKRSGGVTNLLPSHLNAYQESGQCTNSGPNGRPGASSEEDPSTHVEEPQMAEVGH